MAVIWIKKVCSCFTADKQPESMHCSGAVTYISCFISNYPAEDSSGHGQRQNFGCWIRKAFGGSWKVCVSSRKQHISGERTESFSGCPVTMGMLQPGAESHSLRLLGSYQTEMAGSHAGWCDGKNQQGSGWIPVLYEAVFLGEREASLRMHFGIH